MRFFGNMFMITNAFKDMVIKLDVHTNLQLYDFSFCVENILF